MLENKGVHLLLEALRGLDAKAVVVGFGDFRAELERIAEPSVLFTGALEHRHLVNLLPLADVAVTPSIFPEAFGMVAAEAAAAGVPPLVARHSGLAEIAAGLEREYPADRRELAEVQKRRRRRSTLKLAALLSLPESHASCSGQAARRSAESNWSWEIGGRAAARALYYLKYRVDSLFFEAMGEGQTLSVDEQLASAHEQLDNARDFTVAVEEEFALLDPDTLSLDQSLRGVAGPGRGHGGRAASGR